MNERLTYSSLEARLAAAVPELAKGIDMLRQEWKGEVPGPHIVFGDVLNPLLLSAFSAPYPKMPSRILTRIFTLLEQMATDDDPNVRDVVSTTVLERLGSDPERLARARAFMGPATTALSEDIERFWNPQSASPDRLRTARRG